MRRFWILASILIVLAMLGLPTTPVSAQGGRTAFGEPVTIKSGETIDGDLVALGGPVTVENGGEVRGDVVALGGPVSIAGHIQGDVTAWGGPVELSETAVVEGDVLAAGGPVQRSPGAVVKGEITQGFRLKFPPVVPPVPSVPGARMEVGNGSGFLSFVLGLLKIGFRAAGIAIIALLVLIFIPNQTHTVKQMAIDQPIASIGVGILTFVVAILMLGVLVITLCGIPIALILGLALLMALLYGWIAVGVLVGERLLAVLSTDRPLPMISGVVGTLIITLLSSVPCLGWLLGFLGSSWGLGAVVLSRGGTQSRPTLPGGRTLGPAPTAPPPPEPSVVKAPTQAEEEAKVEEQSETPPATPAEEEIDDLQSNQEDWSDSNSLNK